MSLYIYLVHAKDQRNHLFLPVSRQLFHRLLPGRKAGGPDPGHAQKVHVASQLHHGKVVVEEGALPELRVKRDPAYGVPLLGRLIGLKGKQTERGIL